MLLVIYPDIDLWNFVLKRVPSQMADVTLVPLNRYCNKWQRGFRQIFFDSKLPSSLLLGKQLRRHLHALGEDDSLLICDYAYPNLLKTIASIVDGNVRKSLWLWNPISDIDKKNDIPKLFNALGYTGFTFNSPDVEEYGMQLLPQFFNMFPAITPTEPVTDFFFLGFDKNRREILDNLRARLDGFKTDINVITNVKDILPFNEYFPKVCRTRCIIDIVQPGQKGITLRPLEALALKKKLLTNNPSIKNYAFYNPKNIFILGEDDLSGVYDFIKTPFFDSPQDVINLHDTTTWLRNFI